VANLLTLPALATRLRLPREWLRQESLAGRIPCLRVGRRLLFNLGAVETALAIRAGTSTAASLAEEVRHG
jgi:hypothetical protein